MSDLRERFIQTTEIEIGGTWVEAHSITTEPMDEETFASLMAEGQADRDLTTGEEKLYQLYPDENWLQGKVGDKTIPVPFVPYENYLENPGRVAQLEISLASPFVIHPSLKEFKEQLIREQLDRGRPLTDTWVTSVAGFDPEAGVLKLRPASYFDVFATQNFGQDIPFGKQIKIDGLEGGSIRKLIGDGKLPEFGEDSLVANVLGVGGILETIDGKIIIPKRKSNLGVASLSGTFGLSASGNIDWKDLEQSVDKASGHQALSASGIEIEVAEELGLKPKYVNLETVSRSAMQRIAQRELGLRSENCTITPIGLARDVGRVGLPQMVYFLKTNLTAREVVGSMASAPDARKEFDMVLAAKQDPATLIALLSNSTLSHGVNVNAEFRASLALLQSGEVSAAA